MNKLVKKMVASVVGAAMAVSMSAGVLAQSFTDMPNDWRTTAIENAVKNGLISGMGDGTVAPDANITRAQMATIIVQALGASETADISGFKDVSADAWYYPWLSKAVYMGAFAGDGQNLNPGNSITFQECFTVLSKVFGLCYRTSLQEAQAAINIYPDGADVADWAKLYYGSLLKNGYWTGGEKKLLTPTAYITRGEFAVVMDNLVKTYISEPGEVSELPEGNVVVRSSDVVLNGVKVNGDLIIGDGVAANKLDLKDITVSGRLVYRGCATKGEVEVSAEDGTTKKKLSYTEVGNSPAGTVDDIQLIAPYIWIDLANLKYNRGYTVDNTCVNLPITQQETQDGK